MLLSIMNRYPLQIMPRDIKHADHVGAQVLHRDGPYQAFLTGCYTNTFCYNLNDIDTYTDYFLNRYVIFQNNGNF